MNELVTKSFTSQCMAFPDRVEKALAGVETVEDAKGLLDQASTMQHYAAKLGVGIEVARPISLGVLKIKAKLGELMPREKGGRGKKLVIQTDEFSKMAKAAYRKIWDNAGRLSEYYDSTDDVPGQTDFIRWCGADNIIATKHGNDVVDWYTPKEYIDKAIQVMGGIDLDPASSKWAQKVVKAKRHYTAADDGLEQPWAGRVFLNPPYKMPLVEQFVFRLCDHIESGEVKSAILLTNNSTDPKWWQRAAGLANGVCFTAGRIAFYNRAGEDSSPTNGQTFCYFGKARKRFETHFAKVGLIL